MLADLVLDDLAGGTMRRQGLQEWSGLRLEDPVLEGYSTLRAEKDLVTGKRHSEGCRLQYWRSDAWMVASKSGASFAN